MKVVNEGCPEEWHKSLIIPLQYIRERVMRWNVVSTED